MMMADYRPIAERIWDKVTITESCWLWTGAHSRGYAVVHGERVNKNVRVHRWMYEQFIGPIPEDTELDHLCRRTGCINPEHLEAVTHTVNLLRGETLTSRYKARNHCSHGHEYTVSNTYWRKGARICRRCRAMQMVVVNRRKRDAVKARTKTPDASQA